MSQEWYIVIQDSYDDYYWINKKYCWNNNHNKKNKVITPFVSYLIRGKDSVTISIRKFGPVKLSPDTRYRPVTQLRGSRSSSSRHETFLIPLVD